MFFSALAAVAAASASYAQVSITGGLAFGFIKDVQARASGAAARGIVNTDAYIDIAASEDLGGGSKVSAAFEFNADGGRTATTYAGDKSLVVTTPLATYALVNTRSGGNQGAALVAPVNLWEGAFDVGNVITRANIDVAAASFAITPTLKGAVKYVEAYNTTYTAATYAPIPTGGFGAGDGAQTPQTTTMTYALTYASGPLTATGQLNVSNATDEFKVALAALGVTDPRLTSTDLSVIYDAGVAKLGFGYDSPRRAKQNGTDEAAFMLGVSVPLGKLSAGVNYAKRDTSSLAQVGVQYDLSKRTNINGSYGTYTTGGKGLVAGSDFVQDTWKLSLNHSF